MIELRDWWVTVRLDVGRTRDCQIQAASAWSAGWLYRQLHSDADVVMVRPVPRTET
jgi:hypothetical protein